MKARIEYLTQRPVSAIRSAKKRNGYQVEFEDGAQLTFETEKDDPSPEIVGLTLLDVTSNNKGLVLMFGRSTRNAPPTDVVEVRIAKKHKFKIDMPGYDDEDRDLEIPPHPDERVADGPEEGQPEAALQDRKKTPKKL
jgi:hypothetical protein